MKRLWMISMVLMLLAGGLTAAQGGESYCFPAIGLQFHLAVSPDGRLVATTEDPLVHQVFSDEAINPALAPVRLYDWRTGEEVAALAGEMDYASDLAFSPDSTRLAAYFPNGYLTVWDVASGDVVARLPAIPGPYYIAFLPDGESVLVAGQGAIGLARLDLGTGHIMAILAHRFSDQWAMRQTGGGYAQLTHYTVAAFALNTDGARAATSAGNGSIWVWDVASGDIIPARLVPSGNDRIMPSLTVRRLHFTPDGGRLVFFDSETRQTYLWDVASGAEIAALPLGDTYLALSPDGETIAWAERDEPTVSLLRLDQPDALMTAALTLPPGVETGWPVAHFTPDGAALLVGGLRADPESFANTICVVPLSGD